MGTLASKFLKSLLQVLPKALATTGSPPHKVQGDATKKSRRLSKKEIEDCAMCAETGDVAGIKAWLEKGADPNEFWCDKFTPLMLAAKYGHAEAVEVLLPVSDARLQGLGGENALMLACLMGHGSVLKLLLPVSNAQAVNHHGRSALMIAAAVGSPKLVTELLPVSDVEALDHKGASALDLAKTQGVINSGSADAAGAIKAWTEAKALSLATRPTEMGTLTAPAHARRARSL